MSTTAFTHRLILVVPVARFAAFSTWYQSNIDNNDDGSKWPSLNAAGDDSPATHRWSSTVLTDAMLKAVLAKAYQIGSKTPPTNGQWNGWSKAQKKTWVEGTRDTLLTASGIWLDLRDQAAKWSDPEAALTKVGIKRRGEATERAK